MGKAFVWIAEKLKTNNLLLLLLSRSRIFVAAIIIYYTKHRSLRERLIGFYFDIGIPKNSLELIGIKFILILTKKKGCVVYQRFFTRRIVFHSKFNKA